MGELPLSRRAFLRSGSSMAGAAWLSMCWPGIVAAAEAAAHARKSGAFKVLGAAEAADLAAIAARIFPTDETPGATEAGVIHFIDQALAGFMHDALPPIRAGLAALAAQAGAAFAGLPVERQDAALKAAERTPFFGAVQFLTVAGMFALPQYGGNRDQAGWKLLGFEPRHFWQPPFGHYDAAAMPPAGKPPEGKP